MPNPARWWRARRARRQWADEALITVALCEKPDQSGWPLMEKTGLSSDRVYVALARMEAAGRVVSSWQAGPYPRRRLYRLTERKEP